MKTQSKLAMLLFLVCFLFIQLAASEGAEWNYEGDTGPEHWCELDEAYAACCEGTEQSPIDIIDTTPASAPVVTVHYDEKKPVLSTVNNGHTVMTTYDVKNYIEIDGKRYDLVQFHFHYLSEHLVNGTQYPMELHLVHRSSDGDLAVLGVFIEEGKKNKALKKAWKKFPDEEGETYSKTTAVKLVYLLPDNTKSYYSYDGSLTTPPCSEGVKWTVFTEPVTLSSKQIESFKSAYSNNFRPAQSINECTIYFVTIP